jgi:hypothetical protein
MTDDKILDEYVDMIVKGLVGEENKEENEDNHV